jgi:hypothetical protein
MSGVRSQGVAIKPAAKAIPHSASAVLATAGEAIKKVGANIQDATD